MAAVFPFASVHDYELKTLGLPFNGEPSIAVMHISATALRPAGGHLRVASRYSLVR
jgi:hypothetical protein